MLKHAGLETGLRCCLFLIGWSVLPTLRGGDCKPSRGSDDHASALTRDHTASMRRILNALTSGVCGELSHEQRTDMLFPRIGFDKRGSLGDAVKLRQICHSIPDLFHSADVIKDELITRRFIPRRQGISAVPLTNQYTTHFP